MTILARLDLVVARVRPIWYILAFLAAIPAFGALYTLAAPHGFYAPYAHFEPAAAADVEQLGRTLKGALSRSLRSHNRDELDVGALRLNPDLASIGRFSDDGKSLLFGIVLIDLEEPVKHAAFSAVMPNTFGNNVFKDSSGPHYPHSIETGRFVSYPELSKPQAEKVLSLVLSRGSLR